MSVLKKSSASVLINFCSSTKCNIHLQHYPTPKGWSDQSGFPPPKKSVKHVLNSKTLQESENGNSEAGGPVKKETTYSSSDKMPVASWIQISTRRILWHWNLPCAILHMIIIIIKQCLFNVDIWLIKMCVNRSSCIAYKLFVCGGISLKEGK